MKQVHNLLDFSQKVNSKNKILNIMKFADYNHLVLQ